MQAKKRKIMKTIMKTAMAMVRVMVKVMVKTNNDNGNGIDVLGILLPKPPVTCISLVQASLMKYNLIILIWS